MSDKIIRMTPDELGYVDRGKMKWLGLILSDQTELHKKQNEQEAARESIAAKPEMTEFEITQVMQLSYLNQSPVNIQANILKDGKFYPDVNCIVAGFMDDDIYLQLKDGRTRTCTVDQVRNIEFADVNEWYEKK